MKLFLCVLLFSLVTAQPRVKLVSGYSNEEGIVKVYHQGRWTPVCGGDAGLARLFCMWSGYKSGSLATTSSMKMDSEVDRQWLRSVRCPSQAESLEECEVELSERKCPVTWELAVQCYGYKDCVLDTGFTIPGNTTLQITHNRACYCGLGKSVSCRCSQEEPPTCPQGQIVKVDDDCNVRCESSECRDVQSQSLCRFYRAKGQCAQDKVQRWCRSSCGLCDSSLLDECKDERGRETCEVWKANDLCDSLSNVRLWCKKTCGACKIIPGGNTGNFKI